MDRTVPLAGGGWSPCSNPIYDTECRIIGAYVRIIGAYVTSCDSSAVMQKLWTKWTIAAMLGIHTCSPVPYLKEWTVHSDLARAAGGDQMSGLHLPVS